MKKIDFLFSEPPQIPRKSKEYVKDILDSGKLFRYSEETSFVNHVSLLESEFSEHLGINYCVAMNSCGSTMLVALKTLNIKPGDKVLFNAYTLAPVPGAIEHACAIPVPVDITNNYTIDFSDLKLKAKKNKAKVLLISHMRGHITDMEKLVSICNKLNIKVIEDCAHTMGATWNKRNTGLFGSIGCFSTQSFKHINSGEGGLFVTNDKDICAKAILYSGSYALYEQHTSRPEKKYFDKYYGKIPNFSLRMSNLSAAILRPQISKLIKHKSIWNHLYALLELELNNIKNIQVLSRNKKEGFIGSSIQFHIKNLTYKQTELLMKSLTKQGVFLKWFGNNTPVGFTEKHTQWKFITEHSVKNTDIILSNLFDMRIPLSLTTDDCKLIVKIINKKIKSLI